MLVQDRADVEFKVNPFTFGPASQRAHANTDNERNETMAGTQVSGQSETARGSDESIHDVGWVAGKVAAATHIIAALHR